MPCSRRPVAVSAAASGADADVVERAWSIWSSVLAGDECPARVVTR